MARARIGRFFPDWVWWILYGLFSIFVLIGIWIVVDAAVYFSDAKRTRGEVVQIGQDPRGTEGIAYFAIIRYRDDTGREIDARTHISIGWYNFPIGQQLEIYYSPSRPREVRIVDPISIFFPAMFFLLFGGLFMFLTYWARQKILYSVVAEWDGDAPAVFRYQDEEAKVREQPELRLDTPVGHEDRGRPSHGPGDSSGPVVRWSRRP